eukprot:SAG31_NODE_7741_length_1605_cov_1.891102_2_plen_166_part_00
MREVNVDSNTVGWYQSSFHGNHLSDTMIRTQYNYQDQIRNAVCIVYDPARSTPSGLSLKAYRLTEHFMLSYKKNKYEHSNGAVLPSSQVFEELPVKIKNSFLITALLREIEDARDQADTDFSAIDEHSGNAFAEKSIEMMSSVRSCARARIFSWAWFRFSPPPRV